LLLLHLGELGKPLSLSLLGLLSLPLHLLCEPRIVSRLVEHLRLGFIEAPDCLVSIVLGHLNLLNFLPKRHLLESHVQRLLLLFLFENSFLLFRLLSDLFKLPLSSLSDHGLLADAFLQSESLRCFVLPSLQLHLALLLQFDPVFKTVHLRCFRLFFLLDLGLESG